MKINRRRLFCVIGLFGTIRPLPQGVGNDRALGYFCTVVDNYGDIGVTWRLARQLVAEHQCAVRLWVDDLRAFERLCPEIDVTLSEQWQQGVQVRHWPGSGRPPKPPTW